MRRRLFYRCYVPAVLVLGALYCGVNRAGISSQTGFYTGESAWLAAFYLLAAFSLLVLYVWACRFMSKEESAGIDGSAFLWGISGILCGVLFLLNGLNSGWQEAKRLLAGAVLFKSILVPAFGCFLSVAAGISLLILGIRLLKGDLHSYYASRSLLWIVLWSVFHLMIRFSQLPIAFRMPQRLMEILLLVVQCVFFLEGSRLICGVANRKNRKWALLSGHSASALGFLWCACPMLSGHLSLTNASQVLDYLTEWALVLFIGLFCFAITPEAPQPPPAEE